MVKNIGFLVIGDEILSGRTADKNINTLAISLDECGYQLCEVRIIPDEESVIIQAVQDFKTRFDYVFTSGGIGGTHDDITFACVAKATHRNIVLNPHAYARLNTYYTSKGLEWTQTRKNMTLMPENCGLLNNPISLAPGAIVDNIFICAGIPKIFNVMLEDALTHHMHGGVPIYKDSIFLKGVGEGTIGDTVAHIANTYSNVSVGSYPHFTNSGFSTEIVIRSRDQKSLSACLAEIQAYVCQFIS